MDILPPLSQELREKTRAQHTQAESQSFISDLMDGKLSLDDYTTYLVQLAWLYDALEEQTTQATPLPSSENIWDDALLRREAITHDLKKLGVPNWKETTRPTPSMQEYVTYLQGFAGRSDLKLIAHHYTRYLGDLSGGQAIAALVAQHYGATPDQLTFYSFPKIENLVRYKKNYRLHLDGLNLSPQQREILITEAQKAFDLNSHVFEDLALTATGHLDSH